MFVWQFRRGAMGAFDRRGALPRSRHSVCCLRCGCQQAHLAYTYLLSGAFCTDTRSLVLNSIFVDDWLIVIFLIVRVDVASYIVLVYENVCVCMCALQNVGSWTHCSDLHSWTFSSGWKLLQHRHLLRHPTSRFTPCKTTGSKRYRRSLMTSISRNRCAYPCIKWHLLFSQSQCVQQLNTFVCALYVLGAEFSRGWVESCSGGAEAAGTVPGETGARAARAWDGACRTRAQHHYPAADNEAARCQEAQGPFPSQPHQTSAHRRHQWSHGYVWVIFCKNMMLSMNMAHFQSENSVLQKVCTNVCWLCTCRFSP